MLGHPSELERSGEFALRIRIERDDDRTRGFHIQSMDHQGTACVWERITNEIKEGDGVVRPDSGHGKETRGLVHHHKRAGGQENAGLEMAFLHQKRGNDKCFP